MNRITIGSRLSKDRVSDRASENIVTNAYGELEKRFQRLAQIEHALTFLQWDHLVMMPPGGNEARAKSIAELAALHQELLTAPMMADLLEEAAAQVTEPDLQRSVAEMERVWRQAACLSADLVKAKSLAGTRCEHGWRTQRRENDWPGFLKNFREVVRLSREEARARQGAAPERYSSPYDALLDLYCTGDGSPFIRELFAGLKQAIPPLLQEVLEGQPETAADLDGRFPVEAQRELSRKLMTCLGFDFKAGRLDVSLHPFSTGDRGDHRITTRFREKDFADALQATAHETGHAAYESGLPERWEGLPVGRARSMCIHESQSLLFEKHVFLSLPFIEFFTPIIHELLDGAKAFDSGRIWSCGTRVRPSLIRIEADEVTYPLHVILRFEIESGLIEGELKPEDVPEAWDEKMKAYLGLSTKDNYRDGCLQDIHWTGGSFGYFPSYTVGAVNAAQFAVAIRRRHTDWRERLGKGDLGFVRQWLGEHVWSLGCRMDAQDILRAATGEETQISHFLDHLRARYLQAFY
jgi:carboxypeptidase Taq